MKKIKLLIALAIFTIVFINLLPASAASNEIAVGDNVANSVYTLSEQVIDEETNKLAYAKISYSKNTYQTTMCSEMDAAGGSIEVSNDAQYVYFPARYLNLTDNTSVSFKYKNNGVERIYLHAVYNAGISKGGVDYKGGITFVCVNVLAQSADEAWNVTQGKSVDGYDVATVLFGNYTKTINDFMLTGFRLYFDYGKSVSEERSFEVYGYEVHEDSVTPTFTSDPRPTRYSKLTSNDVTIKNNAFTVESTATVSAKILEFRPEAYKTAISFTLSDAVSIDFKLDGNSVLSRNYSKGSHTVKIELSGENYSQLDMVFTGNNVNVKITKMEFLSPATIDTLAGSGYTITGTTNSGLTATYNYIKSWNYLKAAIRNYNEDYQYLSLKFNLTHPVVLGVYVNDAAIRSHYEYSDPLPAGDHELLLDVTEFDLLDGQLRLYLDAGDGNAANNVGPEKTITFSEVELLRAEDLTKSDIQVEESFEYTYNGQAFGVTGVTVSPELPITYEYKLLNDSDEAYTTEKPVNAGVYTVRISTPFSEVSGKFYGKTYVYTTLTINKADTDKPEIGDVEFNYVNNTISYDEEVFVVASDENFTSIIKNNGYISNATKLYVKYFASNNYNESETLVIDVTRGAEVEFTINGFDEKTNEVVPSTVEYSTDGINWTTGVDEKIDLVVGKIYIFRTKATSTSFAGAKFYLAVERPIISESDISLTESRPAKFTLAEIKGAEYKLNDGKWQDSSSFNGLTFNEIVTVYIRIKATETSLGSEIVIITIKVGTNKIQSITFPTGESDDLVNGDTNNEVEEVLPEETPEVEDSNEVEALPENTYVATTYAELKSLVTSSNNKFVTTIIISGEIVLTGDLTINGKVIVKGEDGASIKFENDTDKNTIYNSTNSEITFINIKMVRTISDSTEGYLFRLHSNGSMWFRDCEFDVVTLPAYDQQYDRITYVPSGGKVTVYFDNCEFNTEACFYRGTLVFYNSDIEELPVTAGSAVVYDFRKFKVDYVTKTLTFPGRYTVSTSDDFSDVFESGSVFGSETTYYITDGTNTFTYTTDQIQLATPTIDSVAIDYVNETISFASKYLVSKNADFTELVTSGDPVVPGSILYIKEVATGIYMDSEVASITIPSRPEAIELVSEFECTFGFVMEYYPNAQYKIDGEYQYSPVFVGLENGQTYTVTIRLEATTNSFASELYQVQVTLN